MNPELRMLSSRTNEHYFIVRHRHVHAAVATVHFRAGHFSSHFDGGPSSGTSELRTARGTLMSKWGPRGVLACLVDADSGVGRPDRAAPISDEAAAAAVLFDMKLSGRTVAVRWLTEDGAGGWGEVDRVELFDDVRDPVTGRAERMYRRPAGKEALSSEQEVAAAGLATTPLHNDPNVDPTIASTLLAPPYAGSRGMPCEDDVAEAARLLGTAGIRWPLWREHWHAAKELPPPPDSSPQEALFEAVVQGDFEECERAMSAGAMVDVSAGTISESRPALLLRPESTPVLRAIAGRDSMMVRWLLARGSDPNARPGGHSLLSEAAAMGSLQLCEMLISAGTLVDGDDDPTWLLSRALIGNSVEVLRLLLGAGARIVEVTADGRQTGQRRGLARVARRGGDEDLATRIESGTFG